MGEPSVKIESLSRGERLDLLERLWDSLSDTVDELLLIAAATSPEDWTNRICYLPL